MTPRKLLRVRTRAAWRAWLARNHATAKEIWFVFAKAHTGKPRVSYAEAVEEALCFGWIDTTVNRLDADHYVQRFTPRTNKRNWSKLNLDRFDRMVAEGRMTKAGRASRPAGVTAAAATPEQRSRSRIHRPGAVGQSGSTEEVPCARAELPARLRSMDQ